MLIITTAFTHLWKVNEPPDPGMGETAEILLLVIPGTFIEVEDELTTRAHIIGYRLADDYDGRPVYIKKEQTRRAEKEDIKLILAEVIEELWDEDF